MRRLAQQLRVTTYNDVNGMLFAMEQRSVQKGRVLLLGKLIQGILKMNMITGS